MRWLFLALLLLAPAPAFAQAIVISACGTGSYTVGQLHQLTMNPAGYLCVSTTTMAATSAQPPVQEAPKKLEAPKK